MRQARAAPRKPADGWTRAERSLLRGLRSPAGIQAYLYGLAYRAEEKAACPRNVLSERRAHCFDGALLAAAALAELGHPPVLLDLWAERDDDHVLAVFRADGCFGAVAKSNYVGLRFREPIFRTLRELVLSYFEGYFNPRREKTLRAYSGLLHLAQFDRLHWRFRDEPLPTISDRLDALRHTPLLTPRMKRRLTRVDPRSERAGLLGANPAGIYRGS